MTIRAPIPAPADIQIKVFTVVYRKVLFKTFQGVLPGTDLQIELIDSNGKPLANGLYYLQAIAGEKSWSEKLLILR